MVRLDAVTVHEGTTASGHICPGSRVKRYKPEEFCYLQGHAATLGANRLGSKLDRVSPKVRSANMRAIRSKGMKPELAVRRLVHAMGYRYRLHRHELPGRPDMVFPGRRKVIFVHGCFWHQHPDPACKLAHRPKSNLEYWTPKLRRNRERDSAHRDRLREMNWDVLVIWECEVKADDGLGDLICDFLGPR